MEQLEKEQAKKEIIAAVEEYDNIIAFGFKKKGEAVTITATDDPIYDKLALLIQKFLEQLALEVEEECKREEEAALKRFPEEMTRLPYQDLIEAFGGKEYVDFNSMPRGYFQLGYEQAEKDLALTWEDIKTIVETADMMVSEVDRSSQELIKKYPTEEVYYIEVLNRFNKSKDGK